jgi:hypothetical protein
MKIPSHLPWRILRNHRLKRIENQSPVYYCVHVEEVPSREGAHNLLSSFDEHLFLTKIFHNLLRFRLCFIPLKSFEACFESL